MKNIGRNDPCPCGSGKKYKRCCEGSEHAGTAYAAADMPGVHVRLGQPDDAEFRQVWLGDGEEDLTDELIAELVEEGWPEERLREAADAGARYHRLRSSLVFPAEWDDDSRTTLFGEPAPLPILAARVAVDEWGDPVVPFSFRKAAGHPLTPHLFVEAGEIRWPIDVEPAVVTEWTGTPAPAPDGPGTVPEGEGLVFFVHDQVAADEELFFEALQHAAWAHDPVLLWAEVTDYEPAEWGAHKYVETLQRKVEETPGAVALVVEDDEFGHYRVFAFPDPDVLCAP